MDEIKSLIIDSKVENIRLLENLIDEISETLQISQEVYGNLLIASIEAVNNAIVHGNKKDASKKVSIKVWKDDMLNLSFMDEGPGFDYENVPDPTAPENLEKLSGRGIFLMKKLSDEIEFNEEGTEVVLKFNI